MSRTTIVPDPFHQVRGAHTVAPVEAQHATVEHQSEGSQSLYGGVVQVGRDAAGDGLATLGGQRKMLG